MMSRGCSSVGDVGGNDLVAEWRNRDVNRARWVGLGWIRSGCVVGTWKSAKALALFAMVMDPRRVRNMNPCLGSST